LQSTETDARGRYTFAALESGKYKLIAGATGLTMATPREISVPSPTGEYDLTF
jgi:hypothetical protein